MSLAWFAQTPLMSFFRMLKQKVQALIWALEKNIQQLFQALCRWLLLGYVAWQILMSGMVVSMEALLFRAVLMQ